MKPIIGLIIAIVVMSAWADPSAAYTPLTSVPLPFGDSCGYTYTFGNVVYCGLLGDTAVGVGAYDCNTLAQLWTVSLGVDDEGQQIVPEYIDSSPNSSVLAVLQFQGTSVVSIDKDSGHINAQRDLQSGLFACYLDTVGPSLVLTVVSKSAVYFVDPVTLADIGTPVQFVQGDCVRSSYSKSSHQLVVAQATPNFVHSYTLSWNGALQVAHSLTPVSGVMGAIQFIDPIRVALCYDDPPIIELRNTATLFLNSTFQGFSYVTGTDYYNGTLLVANGYNSTTPDGTWVSSINTVDINFGWTVSAYLIGGCAYSVAYSPSLNRVTVLDSGIPWPDETHSWGGGKLLSYSMPSLAPSGSATVPPASSKFRVNSLLGRILLAPPFDSRILLFVDD